MFCVVCLGDDSELSAVNGGGGRRSEMSPPRSKECGEGGGGGVLTTAGHTSGHSTNNYSSTTGRSSSCQQQQREDLLSANDNALEEHERSSPTDMTNTLSDHEKVTNSHSRDIQLLTNLSNNVLNF